MAGLAAGRGSHIEHPLAGLRREREHGQERRGALHHVVPREVLGRRTDGHGGLVDLETVLGPLCDRVEVDVARDQGLRELASARAERVRAHRHRARRLARLDEREALRR